MSHQHRFSVRFKLPYGDETITHNDNAVIPVAGDEVFLSERKIVVKVVKRRIHYLTSNHQEIILECE